MAAPAFKTSYLYLEMIRNKSNGTKYDVISGLFKGIVVIEGKTFMVLAGAKDATHCLNTECYNILSIEELEEDYKNMTFLTYEEADQKAGFEIVKEIFEKLKAAGLVLENDPNIVDVSKYTKVPSEYLSEKQISTTNGSSTYSEHTRSYTQNQRGTFSQQQTNTPPKKEIQPAVIDRKDKKTAELVEAMAEKIRQLANGTYKYVMPEILGDDGTGTTAAEKTTEAEEFRRAGFY